MRSTGKLFGVTGSFLLAAGAIAAPSGGSAFTYTEVLNELTLGEEQSYGGSLQVVMGNNGLIVTNSFINGNPYIMAHQGGINTVLTPFALNVVAYSEVALSEATGTVTFQADHGGTYALYQTVTAGGGVTPVAPDTTIVDGQFLSDTHYQVNDAGVAVYKYRSGPGPNYVQHMATSAGVTVTDPTSHGLSDFNLPSNLGYRRQAVTHNGSVVFAATAAGQNGLYRLDTDGVANPINLPDVSSQTRVIGASDDAVLYTTAPDPLPSSMTSLNLQIGQASPLTLTSYEQDTGGARALNAVMTGNNHVAYFADTFVGYYDPARGSRVVATVGQDLGGGLTLTQISAHALRNSNPMVNDAGVVVFDALLTSGEDPSALFQALLAWDVGSEQLSVVVQADINNPLNPLNSTFDGYQVFGFLADETGVGGDVLKDALSDDSVLGLVMFYGSESEEHVGLMTIAVPEPAGVAALLAGGLLLRRRRVRRM